MEIQAACPSETKVEPRFEIQYLKSEISNPEFEMSLDYWIMNAIKP
jgi:hypothetical protein